MALNNDSSKTLKLVQEKILGDTTKPKITLELINQSIDEIQPVLSIMNIDKEQVDKEAIAKELIMRFSVWIGKNTVMTDEIGHVSWLNSERKSGWRYWTRYQEYLEQKLPFTAIDGINTTTDQILGLLEAPDREGSWDRRGMVVGHVQSGKTGNYTGLICKAADAGYKIIIVLAGLHNNLRAQTQMRLDEGFLGYETSPLHNNLKTIGVGRIDPSIRPQFATHRLENGDFNARFANHLGVSPEEKPWLFVVKKNKSVLQRLHRWIRSHVAQNEDPETGEKIVTHLPLLIIDDEADNASVDTAEQDGLEYGEINPEHEPSTINRLIRRIMHSFTRKAYVGYTATPFANIFIHNQSETDKEGADLFPSSFIINLGAPSNYIGPARLFGSATTEGRKDGLPLIRNVDDHYSEKDAGWMPKKHKSTHIPECNTETGFPESLQIAIESFILSCCARRIRGQGDQHSSMLVHVTRFNAVQQYVYEKISEYIRHLRQHLTRETGGHISILSRMNNLWERDFKTTTVQIASILGESSYRAEDWEQIKPVITDVLTEIDVRMINGTAKDALDYADNVIGLKVIAIGGDKLARGLTLEGLCTSYFLRASRMYDTLMQMGRWFGYRDGYLDLCRLYTTGELIEWFEHIADASEELREEFDFMAASGGTPEDFGLKVKSHPTLMVTSPLKRRTARSLNLSFCGNVIETVALYREPEYISINYDAFLKLMQDAGEADYIPSHELSGKWNGAFFQNIPHELIVDFLDRYKSHPRAKKAISGLLAKFISKMACKGELILWDIAVVGGGVKKSPWKTENGITVPYVQRKPLPNNFYNTAHFSIGRLLSPRDEAIGLSEQAWKEAFKNTQAAWQKDPGRAKKEPELPSGQAIRRIRGLGSGSINPSPEKGLLLIYLIDPESSELGLPQDSQPVVAFGASFPASDKGETVQYEVNNVLWEQEYLD